MKRRGFFCAAAMILLLLFSSMAMGADKRLGYGFGPGLVAGKHFVAGQLIVGLKEGMSVQGIERAASAAGVQVVKEMEGALLLQFASEKDAVEAVPALLMRPELAFVERNGFMRIPPQPPLAPKKKCGGCDRAARAGQVDIRAESVSSDTGTGYQWHLTVIRKTANLGSLVSNPPTVAVLDTGVDYTHPDLSGTGKIILGKNCVADSLDPMDDHGHGTHVAGIIAARSGNGDYGEGVCPNCKVLAVKVLGSDGVGTFFDVAQGMAYARTYTIASYPEVKVINMSLGGPASSLISTEVTAIKTAGKVLVAAAGNNENGGTTAKVYPGAYANTALRVMATDPTDCRAWFSNFSPAANLTQYNIAAPGWYIHSTLPDAGFGPMSGTSMSTPIVSGAAALLWGQAPLLSWNQVVSRLRAYGKPTNCGFAGSTPRVDVRKSIALTAETAIVGGILDPFTGKAPSPCSTPVYAKVKTYPANTMLEYDYTNRGGAYEVVGDDLTPGTDRYLNGERSDGKYINTMLRFPLTITTGEVLGPYLDAMPQARATGYATLILDWKNTQPIVSTAGCTGSCLGREFDLWVKTPSSIYVDPFNNPGDLLTSPYVKNPRDSANDLLPMETAVIASAAPDGAYKVFVDRYPYSGMYNQTYANSQISFQAYNGGVAGLTLHYNTCPCTTQRYWYIGDLTKNGTSYTWAATPDADACTNVKP